MVGGGRRLQHQVEAAVHPFLPVEVDRLLHVHLYVEYVPELIADYYMLLHQLLDGEALLAPQPAQPLRVAVCVPAGLEAARGFLLVDRRHHRRRQLQHLLPGLALRHLHVAGSGNPASPVSTSPGARPLTTAVSWRLPFSSR